MDENNQQNVWHARAVCPHCAWSIYAPFNDLFHVHITCCPKCGCEKYDGSHLPKLYRASKHWEIKIMRWVTQAKLLHPSTWGTGHWEAKKIPEESA